MRTKSGFIVFILFATMLIVASAMASESTFRKLVDVEWLYKHQKDKNIVIVDMSDSLQYQRFHIPGSIHLPYHILNKRLKSGVSLSIGVEKVIKLLGVLGITRETHIVLLDDTGGFNAGRLFWELERLGHPKISVLNGGLVSWVLKNYPVDNKIVKKGKTSYKIPSDFKPKNNLTDLAGVKGLNLKESYLIDVRSRPEYIGSKKEARSGHIPGAKWFPWTDSFAVDKGFKFHSFNSLFKSLNKLGITDKNKPTVLYCRSGHRAAQTYMTLRILGFSSVKLYDGSILEYAKDKSTVLSLGATP